MVGSVIATFGKGGGGVGGGGLSVRWWLCCSSLRRLLVTLLRLFAFADSISNGTAVHSLAFVVHVFLFFAMVAGHKTEERCVSTCWSLKALVPNSSRSPCPVPRVVCSVLLGTRLELYLRTEQRSKRPASVSSCWFPRLLRS